MHYTSLEGEDESSKTKRRITGEKTSRISWITACVAVGPDVVACASSSSSSLSSVGGSIQLWSMDTNTREPPKLVSSFGAGYHYDWIRCLAAVSTKDKNKKLEKEKEKKEKKKRITTLFSGSDDCLINIWTIRLIRDKEKEEELVDTLRGHTASVKCLVAFYSMDKKETLCLASGSADKTIILWNVKRREQWRVLRGHTQEVTCLVFRHTDPINQLISGSLDKTIKVWNISDAQKQPPPPSHPPPPRTLEGPLMKKKSHCSGVNTLLLLGDYHKSGDGGGGDILASGSYKEVFLWDLITYEQCKTMPSLRGHLSEVTCMASSTRYRYFATGSADSVVNVWGGTSYSHTG